VGGRLTKRAAASRYLSEMRLVMVMVMELVRPASHSSSHFKRAPVASPSLNGSELWSETLKLDRFWLEGSIRLAGRMESNENLFSEAQKAFILKQGADGMPGAHLPEGRHQSRTYFN
jgi:hypothetical protein